MDYLNKSSINKLSRRAGVKSISEECNEKIRKIIELKLDEIISTIIVINSEHNTKTIMVNDVYDSLHLLNHKITSSSGL